MHRPTVVALNEAAKQLMSEYEGKFEAHDREMPIWNQRLQAATAYRDITAQALHNDRNEGNDA